MINDKGERGEATHIGARPEYIRFCDPGIMRGAMTGLEHDLKRVVEGEVRFDPMGCDGRSSGRCADAGLGDDGPRSENW